MSNINNPCGHTGFESSVCEICGYPDPSKMITNLRQQVEDRECCGNCMSYYIKWCDGSVGYCKYWNYDGKTREERK